LYRKSNALDAAAAVALAALAGLLISGCALTASRQAPTAPVVRVPVAAIPARPAVEFYVNPDPMEVPGPIIERPGLRPLHAPPIPVDVCITAAEHVALDAYLDQVDAILAPYTRTAR
jgi:hypothetical protein